MQLLWTQKSHQIPILSIKLPSVGPPICKVNGQADLLSIYQGFVADRDLIAEFRDSIQGQKVEENEVDEENVVDKIEKIEQKKEVAGDTLKLDCAKKEAFADPEI